MTSTPTPTPLIVQIVSENQTPWWWAGALTGFFVLLAALVAFLSLRASDKRKLEREDRRQWDRDIKKQYLDAIALIDKLSDLHRRHTHVRMEDISVASNRKRLQTHAAAEEILNKLQRIADEFDLFAVKDLSDAMNDVVQVAYKITANLHDGIADKVDRQKLAHESMKLTGATKKALRIS